MEECGLPASVKIEKEQISEWRNSKFTKSISKSFTHFDIGKSFKSPQGEKIFFEDFLSSKKIESHIFFPFVQFIAIEQRFKTLENEQFIIEPKKRPITYASHQDGYIFSYYSFLLSSYYEEKLKIFGLQNSIIAYRSLKDLSGKGLNNIDYAQKAFRSIIKKENCIVLGLDISKFFENLDHITLKNILMDVLNVSTLSNHWYKVFRRVSRFSYIQKSDLGKYNLIKKSHYGNKKVVDLNRFNKVKSELEKKGVKLIQQNKSKKGIPQGTAISGALANLYMLEFDKWIKKYISNLGGDYIRYSDDLLLVIPFNKNEDIKKIVMEITTQVPQKIDNMLGLEINNKKTELCIFKNGTPIDEEFSLGDVVSQKSVQYLGFTFDGEKILIRNKTLSNFYKKMIKNYRRLQHLNDVSKKKLAPHYKGGKIQYGKYNRKFLYNGWSKGCKYKKNNSNGRWKINKDSEHYYLGFLSYGYTADYKFNAFCKKYGIKNGIRKQLAGHRKKYNDLKKGKL